MGKVIPVIDVFAGPGGLGEGFSLYGSGSVKFDVALSIEKDADAHKTLKLRAFFRQFEETDVPEDYYNYLGGKISLNELYEQWPEQAKKAKEEAWLHELKDGDIDVVRKKANSAIQQYDANHWVLLGGPPCQAYSVVGRARMKNHKADFEDDERHFLYKHYLRIVAYLKPSIFIMENVKGILTASVKGKRIFDKILDDLEYPGVAVKELDERKRAPSRVEYDIYSLVVAQGTFTDQRGTRVRKLKAQDYIIHAEKFGVPQRRHRVILLGVRKDIDPKISTRLKVSDRSVVSDVLDDLPPLRSGITREEDSWSSWHRAIEEVITPPYSEQLESETLTVMKQEFLTISSELDKGGLRVKNDGKISRKFYFDWFHDQNLTVALNHQSKSHMKSDLWRYFFSTCYFKAHGRSPLLTDYPEFLLPNHKNAIPGNTKFLDRFKVQVGELPASTVTSHISKDGHFFIHHDPVQCRAWSVREAARVQTFPDNYFFEGNRTAQYVQVGNAVPPLLAYQIADVVALHIAEMK